MRLSSNLPYFLLIQCTRYQLACQQNFGGPPAAILRCTVQLRYTDKGPANYATSLQKVVAVLQTSSRRAYEVRTSDTISPLLRRTLSSRLSVLRLVCPS